MTLLRRVIACLDVRGNRVVKGTRFVGLRDVGDPCELAARYEREGADEIVFLDISATADERSTMLDLARRTAERLFIPLTIGGGVRSVADVSAALRAGADKVSINSAGIDRPALYREAAEQFGSQCVVASIDARWNDGRWEVYSGGGRVARGIDALEWAERAVSLGAGEILLTSIDRDGSRGGYDIALTESVSRRVSVPVIASGGAGGAEDVATVFARTGAEAALVAGILHDGLTSISEIKNTLTRAGISVRRTAA